MGSQKDIDDLFAQMSGDAPAAAPVADSAAVDVEQAAAENKAAAGLEQTPVTDKDPATAVEGVQADSKVAPNLEPTTSAPETSASSTNPPAPTKGVWGSEPEPRFVKVSDALDDRMVQLEKRMRINEDLMMSFLFHDKINEAYYRLWRVDANDYFRCLCTVKHRIQKARELEKQIASAQKSNGD